MAANNSAPLPPSWTRILEQIETALQTTLNQVPEPAKSAPIAQAALSIPTPSLGEGWSGTLATAESSAAASEAELARAEQMLRDWLAAVQNSRARLEALAFPRIR